MVNVFQRLTRRATTSSGSTVPDPGIKGNNISSRSHDLHRTTSGSSWNRNRRSIAEEPSPRHLILISDNATFDPHIIQRFQAEGFDVTYLGFVCTDDAEKDRKSLEFAVHEKADELEAGERYAIVGIYFRPPEEKKDVLNDSISQHTIDQHIISWALTTSQPPKQTPSPVSAP